MRGVVGGDVLEQEVELKAWARLPLLRELRELFRVQGLLVLSPVLRPVLVDLQRPVLETDGGEGPDHVLDDREGLLGALDVASPEGVDAELAEVEKALDVLAREHRLEDPHVREERDLRVPWIRRSRLLHDRLAVADGDEDLPEPVSTGASPPASGPPARASYGRRLFSRR
jgi:hypothetical protein